MDDAADEDYSLIYNLGKGGPVVTSGPKLMDAAARRAILSRAQIFQGLSTSDLDAILRNAIVRRFGRGEIILHRGDPSSGIFIIVSGKVRISLVSEDGKEVTLAILGSGEVLGEMSVLDGGPCSADATVQEDCVTLTIERSQFYRLLRLNSELCLHFLAMLSRRLRRLSSALEDMALYDLPDRLGRLLLRLAGEHGAIHHKGIRIELKISKRDLSTLVGGSREKVNRQLRRWEQDGVLTREGKWMVILQPDALAPLDAA
jgi:CRP/FNR family transcriptional regulator, cyclic AMP receptor protein